MSAPQESVSTSTPSSVPAREQSPDPADVKQAGGPGAATTGSDKVLGMAREAPGKIGKVSAALQATLSKKIQQRASKKDLVDRLIMRDEEKVNFRTNSAKLDSLLVKRRKKSELMNLGVIKEEEDGVGTVAPLPVLPAKNLLKRDNTARSKLQDAIMARPSPNTLKARNILHDDSEESRKQKALQNARDTLGSFLKTRSAPEVLMEKKVLADIGTLPTLDETKDKGCELTPVQVTSLKEPVKKVYCGWGSSAALTDKGLFYSWGNSSNGRLGIGPCKQTSVSEPQCVMSLRASGRVLHASSGDAHSAVIVDNTLYTWGTGSWGRLGQGDQKDQTDPVPVKSQLRLEAAVGVACGGYHTLVLMKNGHVYSFGWNKNGRLGIAEEKEAVAADAMSVLEPVQIKELTYKKIRDVVAGQAFSVAVTDEGKLFTWGSGRDGTLGHGNEDDQWLPKALDALKHEKIVSVACGVSHVLAINSKQQVYSWGNNRHHQLGRKDGEGCEAKLPHLIPGLENVVHVAAGKQHSVAITADGKVYTWGSGSRGILGHGDEAAVEAPKQVQALANHKVVHAACGWIHTLFVTAEGAVFACGARESGKLGISV